MICLDTNVIIAAINQRAAAVRQRLMKTLHEGTVVGIPAVVLYELWYGIKKSARVQENTDALDEFLALDVTPWPFEPEDAEEAGDVRAALERLGTPIGPYDVLIAAQARRRGAVLVTANKNEFTRVPGLQTQDWTIA
ncbi:MAG TPA: type II toxin-antitoxin system VapC family toxin [Xanthobacteraceae bacterium]|jgi:tRNA(fMet)-specific endonuclease VapC|nr:type II toxin-antitoxin system VapC family toxin [Xanthobacteraceae bacterium]